MPVANPAVPKSKEEWETLHEPWLSALSHQSFGDHPPEPWIELKETGAVNQRDIRWTDYEFLSEKPYRLPMWMASAEGQDPAKAEQVVLHVLDQQDWERVNQFIAMGQSEAQFKLEAEFGNAWLAFLDQCRQSGVVHLFFAPRGVGPTEWTRDEKKRTHLRRSFAILGRTDDSARVWDITQALLAWQAIPGLRDKPLTIQGARQAAGWSLHAAILGGSGYRLDLTDLPATDLEGPAFLNASRILQPAHAVALALDQSHITLRSTKPVNPKDWEFATAVNALLGTRPDSDLVIVSP